MHQRYKLKNIIPNIWSENRETCTQLVYEKIIPKTLSTHQNEFMEQLEMRIIIYNFWFRTLALVQIDYIEVRS